MRIIEIIYKDKKLIRGSYGDAFDCAPDKSDIFDVSSNTFKDVHYVFTTSDIVKLQGRHFIKNKIGVSFTMPYEWNNSMCNVVCYIFFK